MTAARSYIVIELRKELLGPRNGIYEILPAIQSPSSEYVVGVLVPASQETAHQDPDSEPLVTEGQEVGDDDISDGGSMSVPGDVSPTLDPTLRPRSMGLSFVVLSKEPRFDLCLCWARYYREKSGWQRKPNFSVFRNIDGSVSGVYHVPQDPGVVLYVRSRKLVDAWRISVFLVNKTKSHDKRRPTDDEMIFQPEIRITLSSNTSLSPMALRGMTGDPESQSLSLLYRRRSHYARGHLTGVYWREVDPQRNIAISQEDNPFTWEDGHLLPSVEDVKYFQNCDIRTDYLPMYAVEAPDFAWQCNDVPTPNLSAASLSETWNPKDLKLALIPIVERYSEFLESERLSVVPTLETAHQPTAVEHLNLAKESCDRMARGLAILVDNERVRLAFCFMNRVMDLQRHWANREQPSAQGLMWRPFQMAFILQAIEGIVDPFHKDRRICDLLWFPTGGGKTEAYLGLAVFVLALRRLGIPTAFDGESSLGGTGVISRYTLRLLTIQQFRRALMCITAAERLRVENTSYGKGWRPKAYTGQTASLWGGLRFSIGMWVGSSVTPNSLIGFQPDRYTYIAGALDILAGMKPGRVRGIDYVLSGDPAQVLNCPCCGTVLSIGKKGLSTGHHKLSFIIHSTSTPKLPLSNEISRGAITVISPIQLAHKVSPKFFSLTIELNLSQVVLPDEFKDWFNDVLLPSLGSGVTLVSASPTKPGYFIKYCPIQRSNNRNQQIDFEIRCTNWDSCELNQLSWSEDVPVAVSSRGITSGNPTFTVETVLDAFSSNETNTSSFSMPIPAYTVDDQVYHRCPSMLVSTVDKFARLPFEPKAGAIFGNVTHYHSRIGYYRAGLYPGSNGERLHPPGYARNRELHKSVQRFSPPDLIIQDELHLIEGPLGSMVGIYESLVECLTSRHLGDKTRSVKIVASTATIRMASDQIASLFNGRRVSTFPPPLLDEANSFFSVRHECHQMDDRRPGRLYLGVCAPGRAQTMVITRIWATLLQSPHNLLNPAVSVTDVERFWTLVGYFNAIRELASTIALFRQDISERIRWRFAGSERPLDPTNYVALSSLASSDEVPGLLERLAQTLSSGQAIDAAFATSMFGTGVDVNRLGLMVVHGQPKTTSAYIQATGRIGREEGGLVVSFLPSSRPRDLDHYENFVSYHLNLYRHVEPITLAPFSSHVLDRSLGPIIVGMLRNAVSLNGSGVNPYWAYDVIASDMGPLRMASRASDPEVLAIPDLFEDRNGMQPPARRASPGYVRDLTNQLIDRWNVRLRLSDVKPFYYNESSMYRSPQHSVVLGDEYHERAAVIDPSILIVYERAPQSLRDVESTITFGD